MFRKASNYNFKWLLFSDGHSIYLFYSWPCYLFMCNLDSGQVFVLTLYGSQEIAGRLLVLVI